MYYGLHIDKICRKLKDKYKFEYDINSILSDMLYARILEPSSKRSSFNIANEFLEKPSYSLRSIHQQGNSSPYKKFQRNSILRSFFVYSMEIANT